MLKERLKKLEWIILELISEFIFEHTRDIEWDFGIITVTWVKVSSDLSYLDVYVSSLKQEDILPKTLAKYWFALQRKLNKTLNIRKLPKIRFRYDSKWKTSSEIIDTINSLNIEK